jgi:hypothetical protein
MSNFDINEEIEKIIDKSCHQLKCRIKTMVERSQRHIIKQHIAAQKDTKASVKTVKNKSDTKKSDNKKKIHRESSSPSSDSDSD